MDLHLSEWRTDPRFKTDLVFCHSQSNKVYRVICVKTQLGQRMGSGKDALLEGSDDSCKIPIEGFYTFGYGDCTILFEAMRPRGEDHG